MFTPDVLIDTIQNSKKQVVNMLVTNETFKTELIKLVDAQTEFAKGQFKTTLSIAQALIKNASDACYAKAGK